MLGYNIQGINKFMTTNSKNPLTTKVNEKKPDLGQVYTNIDVARFMVSLLDVRKDSRILDPCFGKGIFIDVCKTFPIFCRFIGILTINRHIKCS